MPNFCWAILVALIAVLATGMFFGNPESSSVSWTSPQPDSDSNDLLAQKQKPAQCNNVRRERELHLGRVLTCRSRFGGFFSHVTIL